MRTRVMGTAPSAYLATRRPCRLIGGQSGGQLEICPQEAEAREGGRTSHLPPAVSHLSLSNVPGETDNGSEGVTCHSTLAKPASFVTSTFVATNSFPSTTH